MTDPLDDTQLAETIVSPKSEIEAVPLLRKGYYRTKGGFTARLDTDIVTSGIGVVTGGYRGYVAYEVNGQFAHKDSYRGHDDDPGDSLDLLRDTWQAAPFAAMAQ